MPSPIPKGEDEKEGEMNSIGALHNCVNAHASALHGCVHNAN